MRFLLLALPLSLAACGADEPIDNAANVAAPVLRKGPMLGSVDLSQAVQASGRSPFWIVEIEPGRITYASSDKPDAEVTDFYPISPKVDANQAIFSTQTPKGEPVTITLTLGVCGGTKVAAPLTAQVKIGTRVLTGCARARPTEADSVPANGSADAIANSD